MSTVTLECANCTTKFEKDKHEVSRRKAKPHCQYWFCSRSCSASFGNKSRTPEQRAGAAKIRSSKANNIGNTYNKKWDSDLCWYVNRIHGDGRKKCKLGRMSRDVLHQHLKDVWTGTCALTGLEIFRKNRDGSCCTDNPFLIASIDRINNTKGYELGNIQWTSVGMNLARQHHTTEKFKEYLKVLS